MIKLIVAIAANGVIGKDNTIPWHNKEDMKFFKETTMGHLLIMGRKTWDSLGNRCLPGRFNIVVTTQKLKPQDYSNTIFAGSVEEAVNLARIIGHGTAFIIGGTQIYTESLEKNLADIAIVSHLNDAYEGNSRFPINLLDDKEHSTIKEFDTFTVMEYTLRK